jgi:hypothetical protein
MSSVNVEEKITKTYKATRRLYLNKDKSAIVDENDPQASFLLAAEGNEVSAEDVEKYGLMGDSADKSDASPSDETKPKADAETSGIVREPAKEKVIGTVDDKKPTKKASKKGK